LGAVQNNQFAALCKVIGHEDLLQDVRFTDPVSRAEPRNAAVLRTLLIQVFATRDGAYWERELSARGAPCGLVRDISQVCDAARNSGRGVVLPTTVPAMNTASMAGTPPLSGAPIGAVINAGFVFEHDGPGADASPPLLGEHYREVLLSLSYGEDEIAALLACGAVKAPSSNIGP
jgi:CoA:oxalate CoA-transferase